MPMPEVVALLLRARGALLPLALVVSLAVPVQAQLVLHAPPAPARVVPNLAVLG
jgi:hypothetical protein